MSLIYFNHLRDDNNLNNNNDNNYNEWWYPLGGVSFFLLSFFLLIPLYYYLHFDRRPLRPLRPLPSPSPPFRRVNPRPTTAITTLMCEHAPTVTTTRLASIAVYDETQDSRCDCVSSIRYVFFITLYSLLSHYLQLEPPPHTIIITNINITPTFNIASTPSHLDVSNDHQNSHRDTESPPKWQ
jgi:hypothetical protein